jgi:hypothetical protein
LCGSYSVSLCLSSVPSSSPSHVLRSLEVPRLILAGVLGNDACCNNCSAQLLCSCFLLSRQVLV